MEVKITSFFNEACPQDYSSSMAESGPDVGQRTWRAAMDDAKKYNYIMKNNAKEFRAFIRNSGGWDDKEVAAFTMQELNALFIQWIAGDIREAGFGAGATWEEYEAAAVKGVVNSNLYRNGNDVYWEGE